MHEPSSAHLNSYGLHGVRIDEDDAVKEVIMCRLSQNYGVYECLGIKMELALKSNGIFPVNSEKFVWRIRKFETGWL